MYGVTTKRDVYSKTVSKWSSHDKEKLKKAKSDLSESDYDDAKNDYSTSFSEKIEPDALSKLTAQLDEVKGLIKTSDKTDSILEYVKAIDSDTKNAFELLGKLDKINPSITIDDFNTLLEGKLNHEVLNTPEIIKHINMIHVKNKLIQDQILCELNTLTSNYDYIQNKIVSVHNTINTFYNQQRQMTLELKEMSSKMNSLLNQSTMQHYNEPQVIEESWCKPVIENNITDPIIPTEQVDDIGTNKSIEDEIKEVIDDVVPEEPLEEKIIDFVDNEESQQSVIFKTTPKPNRSVTKNKKK